MEGSYIYEPYLTPQNQEDIKVYTVGPSYSHAETRKSPVIDGFVRRNTYGKEIRFVTQLTSHELAIARTICLGFEQTVCGFDLLRINHDKGQGEAALVIDVNGWSFVKDNEEYYQKCAEALKGIFYAAARERMGKVGRPFGSMSLGHATPVMEARGWRIKGYIVVLRHADRTPKQKFKFSFRSQSFVRLLQGYEDEVLLREGELSQ